MKFNRIISLGIVAGAMFLASCDSAPKGDEAQVADAQAAATEGQSKLAIDNAASLVKFVGNGVGKNHPGSLKIKSGELMLKGTEVAGGMFVIDLNSMDMLETESYIDEKLLPHLLSADFFDAAKFPESTFEITSVTPYTPAAGETVVEGANYKVSGNLKLRDQVKNVTFPARITNENGVVKAAANFDIDRTQWGMSYGNDQSLKDKFISPTVNISLDITAKG